MRRAVIGLSMIAAGCIQPNDVQCNDIRRCDECIAQSGCGWCERTATCTKGNSLGAAVGCADWRWNSCDQTSTCGRNETCADCLLRADCGWCDATTGTASGCRQQNTTTGLPTDALSCTRVDWQANMCGVPSHPCGDRTTCQECMTDPACAWCDTTTRVTCAEECAFIIGGSYSCHPKSL